MTMRGAAGEHNVHVGARVLRLARVACAGGNGQVPHVLVAGAVDVDEAGELGSAAGHAHDTGREEGGRV